MRHPHPGAKVALALLAIVGSLVSTAAPASAATTLVTWTVTGHTLTHWNAVTTIMDDPDAPPPVCAPDTDTHEKVVTHVNDATGTTHITGSTAYSGFDPSDVNIGGTYYQVIVSGANQTTTGTLNPTTDTVTQNLALRVDIKNCAGTSTLCTFTVAGHLTGNNYNGGAVPATGDTVTVAGSAAITVHIGCNAVIRTTILGSTVGVTLQLTAH